MGARGYSALHWASALISAAALLLVLFPIATRGAGSGYRFTNSRSGSALFTASNIKPGRVGLGRLRIRNAGSRAVTISLTQDSVANTGFGAALKLQVHDDSRNFCIYPRRRGACTTYGGWRAGTALRRTTLLSTRGRRTWPAGERHTITVRWTLALSSTNADQHRAARFRLLWHAAGV